MYQRYYQILDLKEGASKTEIKQAYYRLAKKYHPDSNRASIDSEAFLKIKEAFEVLYHGKKIYKTSHFKHKYSKRNHTSYARMRDEMRREAYRNTHKQNKNQTKSYHRKTEYLKNEYGELGRLISYTFLLFLLVFGTCIFTLPFVVLIFFTDRFSFISSIIALFMGLFVLRFAYDWYNDLKIDFSNSKFSKQNNK